MKRLIVFVLLLGLGFLVLKMAIGDESMATTVDRAPPTRRDEPTQPTGDAVMLPQGGNMGIGVRITGPFQITQRRTIPTDTGSRFENVYELKCEDCTPADGGRHLLSGVTVRFFDDNAHTANLTARQALVEIEVSRSGQRSLRDNREIELADAVLESVEGSDLGNIRAELGRVRSTIAGESLELVTLNQSEPIRVVVGGDRGGELRGRGLVIRMPNGSRRADSTLDLKILSAPSVKAAGILVNATGSLHYTERLADGTGVMTIDREVRVEFKEPAGNEARPGVVKLNGETLRGWLLRPQREKSASRSAAADDALAWQAIRVTGSPAEVTGSNLALHSPRLTLVPGPDGRPLSVTADQGVTQLDQLSEDGRKAGFRSAGAVHLIRPASWLGTVHRRFGFPAQASAWLRNLDVVVFESAAELTADSGLVLRTDSGMRLFRQRAADEVLTAVGDGNTEVSYEARSGQVLATADHGFRLNRRDGRDELELGDPRSESGQRFEVRRADLVVGGDGSCRTVRHADGSILVEATSRTDALEASLADRGSLNHVRSLLVNLVQDRLQTLQANGPRLTATLHRGGQTLLAKAPHIHQHDPNHWQLSGDGEQLASLSRPAAEGQAEVLLRAPTIDAYQIAEQSGVVLARGSDSHQASLVADFPGQDGTGVDVHADQIDLMPAAAVAFRQPSTLTGLHPATAGIVLPGMAQPWLLARGSVEARTTGDRIGRTLGNGDRLLVSLAGRSALLVGDPVTDNLARFQQQQPRDRSVAVEGAAVRYTQPDRDRRSGNIVVLTTAPGSNLEIAPRATMRDARARANAPLANMTGTCDGEIEVSDEEILFRGPVHVAGLDAAGNVDPGGLSLDSRNLHMTRNTDSGDVEHIAASGGVELTWNSMWAKSDRAELDLRWNKCIVEGDAELRMADGKHHRARRIEANYETWSVRSYFGTLTQLPIRKEQL